ncbi:hypothetical protein A3K63_01580 [Candidatus Micrarchaeota archaeon RBG_16_49_10]|nr:MAG: hypothetical protein A3K63_01580 [Candidatus Micrarchaeota archaeon RBG_16_49_10]
MERVAFFPVSPSSGDQVTFNVTISNSGDFPSGSFDVLIYLNGALIANRTMSLGANLREGLNFNLGQLSGGEYSVRVLIDSNNSVAEADEANNDRSITLSVGGVGGGGGHSASTTTLPIEGGSITFTRFQRGVEIKPGEEKQVYGKALNTLTYDLTNATFSLQGDVDSSWYSITPAQLDLLKAGRNVNFEITFKIPADAETGEFPMVFEIKGGSMFGKKAFTDRLDLTVAEEIVETTTTTVPPAPEPEKKTLISGLVTFARANIDRILIGLSAIILLLILRELYRMLPKVKFEFPKGKRKAYDYTKSNKKK